VTSLCRLVLAALLCPCGPLTPASAQRPDAGVPSRAAPAGAAAERYEPVFDALRKLAPRGDSVAAVHDFVLQRDAIRFRLDQGQLYLLTPLAGRTVGALFVGRGFVSFAPPWDIERAQMMHVLGDSMLDAPVSAVAFVFADSTVAELERRLTFGASADPHPSAGPVGAAIDHLVEGRVRSVHPTLMSALLNGDANGFFYAYVKRESGEDLMFEIDPQQGEPVLLLRGGRLEGQKTQTISQFPEAAALGDSVPVSDGDRNPLKIEAYRIEVTLGKGLSFAAKATMRVTARRAGVRWARFDLFNELEVDSVVDETGAVDTFFRASKSPELWVRLSTALQAGETRSFRVVYHGDLIRFGSLGRPIVTRRIFTPRGPPRGTPVIENPLATSQWYFMRDPNTWFPRLGPATYGDLQAADMDLTFHSPSRYRLASIGRLVESRTDGDIQTTHWVAERPTAEASFNLGAFDESEIRDPRIPPVTLQVNAEGHRALRASGFLGGLNPAEDVSADVANSLGFFSQAFGPPFPHRFYATEIPYSYGQAFPGLIYLSLRTFQTIDESGWQESFRAHEMAHQWWGIGVDVTTYRDAWLSEGFADFSGLWYMQLFLKDNEKFFKQLDDSRRAIRARRGDVAPIGLGMRLVGTDHPGDYALVVYAKGAWVLQMLRNMMIDFRTMKEDAFTAMMRDFYEQYRGRSASTRDFQRVVERHLDQPMDWFFNEWVNGTAIPTYVLAWRAEPTPENRYALHIRIRQEDVPTDFVMPVPLRIELASGEHAYVRVTVRGAVTEATLPLPAEPKELELNPLHSVLAEVKTEGW
jgi:Peptidase family M1 domain